MQDRPHSAAQHYIMKDNTKSSDLLFPSRDDESATTLVPMPLPRLYQSAVFCVSMASACRLRENKTAILFDGSSCGQSHVGCRGGSQG